MSDINGSTFASIPPICRTNLKLRLTSEERKQYETNKQIVRAGQAEFVRVGLALMEICDNRLYRDDYGSFAEFCESEYDFSDRRGRQLIAAARLVKEIQETNSETEAGGGEIPKTERAARAMISTRKAEADVEVKSGTTGSDCFVDCQQVAESKHVVVTPEAAAVGGPSATVSCITEKVLKPVRVVDVVLEDQAPSEHVALDKTGHPIPHHLMAFWARGAEPVEFLRRLGELRGVARKAQEEKDQLYNEVNFSALMAALDTVVIQLKGAVPYAVCPACNGLDFKHCAQCRTRGVVSKFMWDMTVPSEVKALRAIKKGNQNANRTWGANV